MVSDDLLKLEQEGYPGIFMLLQLGWLERFDCQEGGFAYKLSPETEQLHQYLVDDGYTFGP